MQYTKKTVKPLKTQKNIQKQPSRGRLVRYYRTKISLSIILGLSGGLSWGYVINQTPRVLASYKSENIIAINKHTPVIEVLPEKETSPIDCYTSAEKYGPRYGADVALLKRIIKAESGNNARAENRLSSATGCFQWITKTWQGYGKELWKESRFEKSPYNYEDNTEMAAYVIGKYGIEKAYHEWAESRHNWEKEAF